MHEVSRVPAAVPCKTDCFGCCHMRIMTKTMLEATFQPASSQLLHLHMLLDVWVCAESVLLHADKLHTQWSGCLACTDE